MIIATSLVIPVIAVTTVATVIFIGLGFLPRPSRATALWASGFAVAMTASYFWIGYEATGSVQVRAVAVGLIIAPMGIMWSGVRAFRGRERTHLPISLLYLVVVPLILVLTAGTPVYGITFRAIFAATGVFAALTIIELLSLGKILRDEVLPMVLAASFYIVFSVVTIVDGVLVASGVITPTDSLTFVRTLNMIGATVYVVCNLVTTLLLTTRADAVHRSITHAQFQTVAEDRLERAKAVADPWWSLLDIRIDNPDDIRAASSTADFNKVSDRFVKEVRAHLPADADIEVMSPTRVVALVPRAQGGLREILTALLENISTVDPSQPVPIGVSASIGWAQVSSVGYDLDDLIIAAAAAAIVARADGGDRWERVRGTE